MKSIKNHTEKTSFFPTVCFAWFLREILYNKKMSACKIKCWWVSKVKRLNILVIDGQGGGVGRQLVENIKKNYPSIEVTVVGTNALATQTMLKAGADHGATGENAVIVGCRTADIILGPLGIVIADSLWVKSLRQWRLPLGKAVPNGFFCLWINATIWLQELGTFPLENWFRAVWKKSEIYLKALNSSLSKRRFHNNRKESGKRRLKPPSTPLLLTKGNKANVVWRSWGLLYSSVDEGNSLFIGGKAWKQ